MDVRDYYLIRNVKSWQLMGMRQRGVRETKEGVNYGKSLNLGDCKNTGTIHRRSHFQGKEGKLYFEHIELLEEK